MKRLSIKKGIRPHNFSRWLHRIHGVMNIWRVRKDGIVGCSLPCVMCRKMIEKNNIQWRAYDGQNWIHSNQCDVLTKSQPTNKQRRQMNFTACV